MDPVITTQIAIAVISALFGWGARHFGLGAPATPPTQPAPANPPAPANQFPTGVGHGQVLAWLVQQLQVDMPKLLTLIAQASQQPSAPKP